MALNTRRHSALLGVIGLLCGSVGINVYAITRLRQVSQLAGVYKLGTRPMPPALGRAIYSAPYPLEE